MVEELSTSIPQGQTAPPVEGQVAFRQSKEVLLNPNMPRSPTYVFRRLLEADQAIHFRVDLRDKTEREVRTVFDRLVEEVTRHIWTKAALLKANPEEGVLVFANGVTVTFLRRS